LIKYSSGLRVIAEHNNTEQIPLLYNIFGDFYFAQSGRIKAALHVNIWPGSAAGRKQYCQKREQSYAKKKRFFYN
jgi:hypothetical protein